MSINPLHIDKDISATRVIVAMSGGVDSSVTAALLKEMGYEVIGITLQLYNNNDMTVTNSKACCAGLDIYDAKMVADHINIPHYVLDYESRFKQDVIDDFADSYLRGETPLPCVRCNQSVKFKDLLTTAKQLGGDALVTGHYVRRAPINDGHQSKIGLYRAIDDDKDQSYFLFATTQDQLDYIHFPLGNIDKKTTRQHGERLGLKIADKPDSQDICFVPNGSYGDLVTKLRPDSVKAGDIIHVNGEILGQHHGIVHYTIGQRKRIGIGGRSDNTDPLYVVKIDADNNTIIVGEKSHLGVHKILLHHVNWLGDKKLSLEKDGISCTVKYRSMMRPVPARVVANDIGDVMVIFDHAEFGVSPGQACVFYDNNRVLGGGWIVKNITEAR